MIDFNNRSDSTLIKELRILESAKERIIDPINWTTDSFARDHLGKPVSITNRTACKFCMMGAMVNVTSRNERHLKTGILEVLYSDLARVLKYYGYPSPYDFNDSVDHSKVIEFLDQEIARRRDEVKRRIDQCLSDQRP